MRTAFAVAAVALALAGCSASHVDAIARGAWPPVAAVEDAFARSGVRVAAADRAAVADAVGDASPLPYPFGQRLPSVLADRADRLPGRAPPAAPATAGERTVLWGSRGDLYQSRIAVGDDGRAHVQTVDDRGRLLVEYDARAFVDDRGSLHLDARSSPISGPMRGAWSPDSFAIDASGNVVTLDDAGQAERGSTGGSGDG